MSAAQHFTASRRQFLVSSGAGAAGLALGFHVPSLAQSSAENAEINAWVVVQPDDTCLVRVARAEMGQGTHTGLAMLVAEELECDWSKVKVQSITPGQNLARKRVWRNMATGGSRGIRESHDYVRQGGAAARMMLLQAAANQWSVPLSELAVDKGVITHSPTRRQLRYGQVAAAASQLTPPDPKTITLKSPKYWKIAGKPIKRLDTAQRVNGQIKYGIDTALPGMLYAAITDCPVFGGKLVSCDADRVRSRRGIRGVVRVDETSVAVVADSWWRAKMALQDLPIVWNEGPNAKESSAAIAERLKAGLTATQEVFADLN
ncbi:MAG: molybdopterin cofactor-binding domain-containing protein, partial [Rubrivivax sp.]